METERTMWRRRKRQTEEKVTDIDRTCRDIERQDTEKTTETEAWTKINILKTAKDSEGHKEWDTGRTTLHSYFNTQAFKVSSWQIYSEVKV